MTIQEDPPGHLSVSWPNVDLGDYYVAFVKSDDGLEVHCNTSLTQCHFLSECGFTYFISVFAYNKAGQSPLGDVFNYTTGKLHVCKGSPELTKLSPSMDLLLYSVTHINPLGVKNRKDILLRVGTFGFVDPPLTRMQGL